MDVLTATKASCSALIILQGTAQRFAQTGRRRWHGLCLRAEKSQSQSLSKYDLWTLNTFPDLNVAFGDIVPEA